MALAAATAVATALEALAAFAAGPGEGSKVVSAAGSA